MGNRVDVSIGTSTSALVDSANTNYMIITPGGVRYFIHLNQAIPCFRKSNDGGYSWSSSTVLFATGCTALAVWYDRWSGISGDLIHCVYVDSAADDTRYRTINAASSDALSTETIILLGTSTANLGMLSVVRARGGNVYCRTMIDAGAEGGFFRLLNANVPNGAWDAARTINEANATTDQICLMPGFAADNQDIIAIFYDHSATELSRQLYDDSANTWAETSIDTDCTFPTTAVSSRHFGVVPDLANSRLFVIMWNAVDTANADLRAWTVTESAITALTPVVANGTDDQGLAALSLDTDTGYLYAFYCGKSDGSETWSTAVNTYYKISTDAGSTWGPETKLSGDGTILDDVDTLISAPNFTGGWAKIGLIRGNGGTNNNLSASVPAIFPAVAGNMGI